METSKPSANKIILNYGLLMAMLSVVLQVISYVLDVHIERPWWLSVLLAAITIGVIVMGIWSFKKENGTFLSLSDALKTGIGISLVAAIIVAVFNFIFIYYIDPNFVEKVLDITRRQLEENPQLTPEQVEMSLNMSRKFMSPWLMTAFSILGGLFFGFIISLIAGLAMRKTPPVHL